MSNLQKAIDRQFNGRNVVVSDNRDGTFTISFLDTLKDYKISGNEVEEDIDWNEAMANAIVPESQDEERNENVIGIGTDGQAVDMDLWEYALMDNGTYGLNDIDALKGITPSVGYLGDLNSDETQSKVPQYISTDNGKTYRAVTSMYWTFRDYENLENMPEIPLTITEMSGCFMNCSNLVNTSNIPGSVKSLYATFYGCSKLSDIITIPSEVEDMRYTFYQCTLISDIKILSNKVTNMYSAFYECTSLENMPIIPDSVEIMYSTFQGCSKLKNISNLPNNLTDMRNIFKECIALESFTISIPNKVTTMLQAFEGCINLKNIQTIIPESVIDIHKAFSGCTELFGNIEINTNNLNNYSMCFYNVAKSENAELTLTGSCNSDILDELRAQGGNIN